MIPIYTAERKIEGLADRIQANRSIAFYSKIEEVKNNEVLMASLANLTSKASMVDVDLFYTKSVFVTTNLNKNDDFFDKEEVWAARNTPSHKRTNLEHDEKKIVGHITDVWPIDEKGNILAEDTTLDDLPDVYHLVNGAVIYRYWEDKDYKELVAELIEDIQEGKKYVSMECLFNNFAYAIEKDGIFNIVERDKDTAFLTAYLRAYGGKGEYEGAKIGRMPRNIVFSGKGYVDKPANPDSIIFGADQGLKTCSFSSAKLNNIFSEKSGVINISASINKTEIQPNMTEKEIQDLKDAMAKAEASVKELNAKLETSKASAEADKKTAETELATVKAQVLDLTKAKDTAENTLKEVQAKAKASERASKLVTNGFSKEDADKKVTLFANLSDEQFDVLATEMKKPAKAEVTPVAPVVDPVVDPVVLETVTPVAAPVVPVVAAPELTVASEKRTKTRGELVELIKARLGHKTETQTKE